MSKLESCDVSVVEAERSGAVTELTAQDSSANLRRMKNFLRLTGGKWFCARAVESLCARSHASSTAPFPTFNPGLPELADAGSIAAASRIVPTVQFIHRTPWLPISLSASFSCATTSANTTSWANTGPSPSFALCVRNTPPDIHGPAGPPSPTSSNVTAWSNLPAAGTGHHHRRVGISQTSPLPARSWTPFVVEGLVIKAGGEVQVRNAISLPGGLCGSFLDLAITAQFTHKALLAHGRAHGLPASAQFDNDLRFHGPHSHPDRLGSVALFCLAVGVTPVFAPPREQGLQNQIESYNNLWQAKVWQRFHHPSRAHLRRRLDRYVVAHHVKSQARQETRPRTPPPASRTPHDSQRPQGHFHSAHR